MGMLLGQKIKKLRKEKGLTLEAFAKTMGLDTSYIWGVENGRTKNPSVEKALAIANALGVTVEDITSGENTATSHELKKGLFYRKMGELTQDDQDKIMKIVDAWSKGE